MSSVPELKTLLVYNEDGLVKKVVVNFIDDNVLNQSEIEDIVLKNCPFDLPSGAKTHDEGKNKVSIRTYDEESTLFSPSPDREIMVKIKHVWKAHNRLFRARECK